MRWFHTLHDFACYAIPRCPGPSHPDTKVRCTGDDETRPYKPRDSARPALLTAVRNRRSGLAVHPRRVLHGPAAPDWRGEHECRARVVVRKDRRGPSALAPLSIYLSIYLSRLPG
eukprot:scaffold12086_cov67-Phaeocystis_antarctica.AAC.13